MKKFFSILAAASAFAASILFALLQREKANHAETKRDYAQGQLDTTNRAIEAQEQAEKESRRGVKDATSKAEKGDFSSLSDRW